ASDENSLRKRAKASGGAKHHCISTPLCVGSSVAEGNMHKPVERLKSEVTVEGRPTVILVGADKGGVGKTIVARTLLDYLVANNVPARAFDTEAPKGTLKRFHP